jgi:RNA polymerase sigma factor (sigma-70 family)
MTREEAGLGQVPDSELVRRFRETRDDGCFAELFARHRKDIYFACRRFCNDASAAEDATQDAFMRAYRNLHQFVGGNFRAWLRQIARNACTDQYWQTRILRESVEINDAALTTSTNPEAEIQLRGARETLQREMKALTRDQRRCLELKMRGYSYEETASRLGVTVAAVKSHLQNGRRMLWLRMKAALPEGP